MTVKILLFPLCLVLAIWLIIWQIAPQYSEMTQSQTLLAEANKKLNEAREKNLKADKMIEEYNNMTLEKDVIYGYLTSEKNEIDILNTLENTTYQEEILPLSITLEDIKQNEGLEQPINLGIPTTSYLPDQSGQPVNLMIPGSENINSHPSPEEFKINLDFSSSYARLKSFLQKLSALKRFNRIDIINVESGTGSADDIDVPADILEVSLEIKFNYLPLKSSKAILNEATFITDLGFDKSSISDIKNKLETDIKPVNFDRIDKTNPFLP